MKKFYPFALLLALSMSAYAQHGVIDIQTNMDSTAIVQYAIDTLESYQVGPGIVYTRFNITNTANTRHCYIYEVDLKNPYNAIEESHSTTIGVTERMVETHARLDSAGHRSIGSVNCNFWYVSNRENLLGVGATGQVRNGKVGASITGWNVAYNNVRQSVGYLMIDDRKRAFVDQYSWNSTVTIGENSYPISESNRNRNNPADNELVLFNSDLGTKTTLTKADIDKNLGKEVDLLEVVVKMQTEWSVNQDLSATVVSTNTEGGTKIADGYAVLRGRGTGKDFLQNLKEGDPLTIHIGIYNSLTEETPNIMQLTAGNCLVMKDGRLTPRNWNEVYNNQNYPRTGFATNATHDKVWLMVMEKPGMFTYEMCSIFRHFGATEAGGADGGGSAQFNLGGKILNPTTEGSPRAVSNAIFLFSTAPDDDVITEMRSTSTFMRLPKYAMLRPTFLGYNQYGMLIDTDLPDVQLSCDENTGYITDDGYFVCLGSGVLTAKYGQAELPIQVVLADDADLSLQLDSVLISNKEEYFIEVNGVVNEKVFRVLPSALDWEVADPAICSVSEEGALRGSEDGRTLVTGRFGDKTLTLIVHVETVDSDPYKWEDLVGIDNRWSLVLAPASSSKNWNAKFDVNADGLSEYYMNFTGGRMANMQLQTDTLLRSAPYAMEFVFFPPEDLVEWISFSFMANNGNTEVTYTTEEVSNRIWINFDELFGVNNDKSIYPIRLTNIKFAFNTAKKGSEYRIPFEGIYLYYAAKTPTGTEEVIEVQHNNVRKIMKDGQLLIINNGHIYNLLGHEITH